MIDPNDDLTKQLITAHEAQREAWDRREKRKAAAWWVLVIVVVGLAVAWRWL
jgi:hypothetical protein